MQDLQAQQNKEYSIRTFEEGSIFNMKREASFSPVRRHAHHGNYFGGFCDREKEEWSGRSEIEDGQMRLSLETSMYGGSDFESDGGCFGQKGDIFTLEVKPNSEDLASGFDGVLKQYEGCEQSELGLSSPCEARNEDQGSGSWNVTNSFNDIFCLEAGAGKCSLGKRDFEKIEMPEKCQYNGESEMSPKIRSIGGFLERNKNKILASTEADSSPKKMKSDSSSKKFSWNLRKDLKNEICASQNLSAAFGKELPQISLKRIKQESLSKQIESEKMTKIEKSRSLMRKIGRFNIHEANLRMAMGENNNIKKPEKSEENNTVYIESEDESIDVQSQILEEEETRKQISENAQIALKTVRNKEKHEEGSRRNRKVKAMNQQNTKSQSSQNLNSNKQKANSESPKSNERINNKINKIKNLKRKKKAPKAPKTSNKSSKNSIDFEKIESVLFSLLMGNQSWLIVYESLNRFELQHIWMVVWKIYKVKPKKQLPSLTLLLKLQKMGQFKRKEEIFKGVYKPFLKHYLIIFKRRKINPRHELKRLLSDNGIDLEDCYYQNPRRAFFIEKFMELIERKIGINLDLIMDICEELALPSKNDAKKRRLAENQNWRSKSVSKVSAMKKISGGFRYLLSRTTRLKALFEGFISKTTERGLLAQHYKQIREKLDKKMRFWVEKYGKLECDDVKFLDSLKVEVSKPKFKFPWSVVTMKASIDCCLRNLKSPKILKEFEEVREMHYTFRV